MLPGHELPPGRPELLLLNHRPKPEPKPDPNPTPQDPKPEPSNPHHKRKEVGFEQGRFRWFVLRF